MSDLSVGPGRRVLSQGLEQEGSVGPAATPEREAPIGDRALSRELAGPITQSSAALIEHVGAVSQNAIAGAKAQIADLKSEIGKLETTNTNKIAEAQQLETSITTRKQELKNEFERKRNIGLIGVMFGVPALGFASLIAMQQDDQRLKQLEIQLTAAKAAQQAIKSKVDGYTALKEKLEAKLETLVEAAEAIQAASAPAGGQAAYLLRAAGANINQAESLLANLRAQIDILVELRGKAAELGGSLDALIVTLKSNLAVADELLAASKRDTLELIKLAADPNPQAAATAFLKKKVMAKVRALLKEAGLSFDPLVDRLLQGVAPGPVRDLLAGKLRAAFENATGFPFAGSRPAIDDVTG